MNYLFDLLCKFELINNHNSINIISMLQSSAAYKQPAYTVREQYNSADNIPLSVVEQLDYVGTDREFDGTIEKWIKERKTDMYVYSIGFALIFILLIAIIALSYIKF